YYPDFESWFESKVRAELLSGQRSILVEYRSGQLAGLAILKQGLDEKKLCCLRIMPSFESSGIGIRLFERSFEVLGTEKPLLSVSEEMLPKFARIFRHFGFSQEGKYIGLYRQNKCETSFNGILVDSRSGLPSTTDYAHQQP
ncbi:MAG: hypothetical protein AB9M53_05405, partial [Leptothrix sp. (in: b-proteobacteria)]